MTIVITGCSAYVMQGQFDESLEAYNESLHWREWEKAKLFVADSVFEEFNARVAAAKGVRMIDYRIRSKTYDAKKGEATVEVEIDYYKVTSERMRTVVDTQRWAYLEEKGSRKWKLVSPIPEFR